MKSLIIASILSVSTLPALACGDSYIILPSGACHDLTAEMRSPLRSMFSGVTSDRSVPSVAPRSENQAPSPRRVQPRQEYKDPFAEGKKPNIVPTPPELRRL